jgi:hypothetical protein
MLPHLPNISKEFQAGGSLRQLLKTTTSENIAGISPSVPYSNGKRFCINGSSIDKEIVESNS